MFSYDCMQARGTPIGVCMDSIYVGSCCRLTIKSPVHSAPTNSSIIQVKLPPLIVSDGIGGQVPALPATTSTTPSTTTAETRSTSRETAAPPATTRQPLPSSSHPANWQPSSESPTQVSVEIVTEQVDKVFDASPIENSVTEKVSASSHQTTTVRSDNSTTDSHQKQQQVTSSTPGTPPSTSANVTDWPPAPANVSTGLPADIPQKLNTTSTQKETSTNSTTATTETTTSTSTTTTATTAKPTSTGPTKPPTHRESKCSFLHKAHINRSFTPSLRTSNAAAARPHRRRHAVVFLRVALDGRVFEDN